MNILCIQSHVYRHVIRLMALMFLSLTCLRCYSPYDYAPYASFLKSSVIISSSQQPIRGQLLADGASIVRITLVLNPDADLTAAKVIFRTGAGAFFDNESTAITVTPIRTVKDNQVSVTCWVDLKAPLRPGTVTVTATVGGYSELIDVNFPKAYPQAIKINQGGLFSLTSGAANSYTIKATVSRNGGITDKPSLETKVTFKAVALDLPGMPEIGDFIPANKTVYSDKNAEVSINYTVGNILYTGRIRITASTETVTPGQPAEDPVIYTVI